MSIGEDEFVFTWRIEDFHVCPRVGEPSIISPHFNVKKFYNTEWCLKFYPSGFEDDDYCRYHDGDCVTCFLVRNSDNGPFIIKVEFKFSINSVSFEKSIYCFTEGDSCSFSIRNLDFLQFLQTTELNFKEVIYIVECRMCMYDAKKADGSPLQSTLSTFYPFWKPELLSSDIRKELFSTVGKEFEGLCKSTYPHPNNCTARTSISVERKSVTCPAKNIVCLKENENIHLPVFTCSKFPDMLITVNVVLAGEVEKFEVKIRFLDKLSKNTLLFCDMQMLLPENETCSIVRDSHQFDTDDTNNIFNSRNLHLEFKKNQLKAHENSYLVFKFLISDGSHLSNIEYSEQMDYFTTNTFENTVPKSITDGIFRLYNEKKFCDATLQTKEKTFDVHKAVLCAMSPVFDVMFQSGMKESSTNKVVIEDIDSDSVSQMLNFMYTGRVERLECDIAINLFCAADKYQISALKNICRRYLQNNLSVENICSVLSIADSYQDKELRESAACFLAIYRNVVFPTEQWKCLAESNAKLGLEILQEVCSKYC